MAYQSRKKEMNKGPVYDARGEEIGIQVDTIRLSGIVTLPEGCSGVVVFAHGSGSGRHSPRNQFVASSLQQAGLGTLLLDLLTPQEEEIDVRTREHRFNIPLLAERLVGATDWLLDRYESEDLSVGYFGSSTGAAAALIAAAERVPTTFAVVSRGGRIDLAAEALPRVKAPTLLIVGGRDYVVIDLNERAIPLFKAPTRLEIVPGASHLFEEAGALEEVARLARSWFRDHLSTHKPGGQV
jgi:putative phosphoribosyl transferase